MAWSESESDNFAARHDDAQAGGTALILELLEDTRARLERLLPALPGEVTVVVHATPGELMLGQPAVALMRAATAPASRRYLVGWVARDRMDVLGPAALNARASGVEGSREMLRLAPAALYAQLAVAANGLAWPPPYRPVRALRAVRWAWLVLGGPAWLGGQTPHARAPIARRLREGNRPAFPPALGDAALLGGTILDLLTIERGRDAAVTLACAQPDDTGAREIIARAFDRDAADVERRWRAHLDRVTGREERDERLW
ncbi:MAG: hypothetical protein MSC31_01710 [Solirubrobacteraceae bacterium MAG38_C4-C5]|nr:hypothetical protein [Candidatus Siliceabacter maunaloa]